MEQNLSKIAEEASRKAMQFLMETGLLIISIMSYLSLLSLQLGLNIVRMLGMTANITPLSKSSLEMEEWLQLSTGTISSDLKTDSSKIVDSDISFCMASDNDEDFCGEFARKKLLMPFDLPEMYLCDRHADMFSDWTDDDTIRELVDLMTDEEGIELFKEGFDDDI
jgi:hypothetical protein